MFAKEQSQAFPLSSKLPVFPSCWSDGWAQDIKSEISRSETLFGDKNYAINVTLAMLNDYLGYENKQQFFDALQPESMRSDVLRRVSLHLALNVENYVAASELFSSIHKKGEYDILFYAFHMANNNNYADAENLVHYFFKLIKLTGSNDASLEKIALVIHVLETLENNNKLGRFSPSLRAGLEKKLQPFNVTAKHILTFDHLCK